MWCIVSATFLMNAQLYFMVERDWLGALYAAIGLFGMFISYCKERELHKKIEDLEKKIHNP